MWLEFGIHPRRTGQDKLEWRSIGSGRSGHVTSALVWKAGCGGAAVFKNIGGAIARDLSSFKTPWGLLL